MPSTSSSISGLNKGKGREGLESGIYGRDIPVTNHFVVTRTKIFSLKTEFFLFTEDWILITKMVISTIVLLSWDSFAFVTSNLDHLVPSVYATMHVLCLLTLIVLQKLWGCTCVHPCPYWVCSCTFSKLWNCCRLTNSFVYVDNNIPCMIGNDPSVFLRLLLNFIRTILWERWKSSV